MLSKYELYAASISSMYHDIQRLERMVMAKYGLKGPHAQCLLTMSHYPQGISAAQLCRLCEKDKAAISRIISELEQAGLVLRGSGRYRTALVLTPDGALAAQAVQRASQQAVERAGAGLTDPQRDTFYQTLALIAGRLHAICQEGLEDPQEVTT